MLITKEMIKEWSDPDDGYSDFNGRHMPPVKDEHFIMSNGGIAIIRRNIQNNIEYLSISAKESFRKKTIPDWITNRGGEADSIEEVLVFIGYIDSMSYLPEIDFELDEIEKAKKLISQMG